MPHTPGHLKRTGRVYNKEEGLSPSSGAGLTGNPNQMQQDQILGGTPSVGTGMGSGPGGGQTSSGGGGSY